MVEGGRSHGDGGPGVVRRCWLGVLTQAQPIQRMIRVERGGGGGEHVAGVPSAGRRQPADAAASEPGARPSSSSAATRACSCICLRVTPGRCSVTRRPRPSSNADSRSATPRGSSAANSPDRDAVDDDGHAACSSRPRRAPRRSSRSVSSRRPAPQASIQSTQVWSLRALGTNSRMTRSSRCSGRPAAGGQPAGLGDVALGLVPEHLGEEDVLGGEVVVDQAAADLGGRRRRRRRGCGKDPARGRPAWPPPSSSARRCWTCSPAACLARFRSRATTANLPAAPADSQEILTEYSVSLALTAT